MQLIVELGNGHDAYNYANKSVIINGVLSLKENESV